MWWPVALDKTESQLDLVNKEAFFVSVRRHWTTQSATLLDMLKKMIPVLGWWNVENEESDFVIEKI